MENTITTVVEKLFKEPCFCRIYFALKNVSSKDSAVAVFTAVGHEEGPKGFPVSINNVLDPDDVAPARDIKSCRIEAKCAVKMSQQIVPQSRGAKGN